MTTLRAWLAEKPFTLAMSSGYFGFFAHAGALCALEEAGLAPSAVRGSSAGALVTGLWSAGLSGREIGAELKTLRRTDFWDPRPGLGLLRGGLFQARLESLLPVKKLEECRVPVSISVFDTLRARTVVLQRGDLAAVIRASCALPLLFQPVWIGRRPYLDGGIGDRSALALAPDGERILYHHLPSSSPWRRKNGASQVIPRRRELAALVTPGLPRVSPFALEKGAEAFELARAATGVALKASPAAYLRVEA